MNPVARFESFIERLMERTFTRATRTTLQPVEIGKRLVRAMESEQSVGTDGVIVPNMYTVHLSPNDYEHFRPMRRSTCEKLEAHLARIARQRRFQLVSRPQVMLQPDASLGRGDILVETSSEDVEESQDNFQHTAVLPRVEAGFPFPTRPAAPSIYFDGQSYSVLRSPTSVGRYADNDIVFNDNRVSRHHAQFVQQGPRWVLKDAGSTNGTAVNGRVVTEAVLKPGDQISLGGLEVTWEQ